MPKQQLSVFKQHCETWKEGCGSEHCSKAHTRVLCRGKVPCDILFIGEAPGESENAIGVPFIGPAGKLLDHIVKEATEGAIVIEKHQMRPYRIAFTNVVGCIPRNPESGKKWEEPDDDQVETCRPRLEEFIMWIAKPSMIVAVGKVAEHWLTPGYKHSINIPDKCKVINIVHPAAIMRANVAQQGFTVQKCIVEISNALENL